MNKISDFGIGATIYIIAFAAAVYFFVPVTADTNANNSVAQVTE